MNIMYRVSVRFLDFSKVDAGECGTISYCSRFLPSGLGDALYTAKTMGSLAPSVYNLAEPCSMSFHKFWVD
jgi:hypothetical protein